MMYCYLSWVFVCIADSEQSYPSPLNYNHFPKFVCTVLDEDVTLYHGGYHGNVNIGKKAKADADSVRAVDSTRECLDSSIELVKSGALFRAYVDAIDTHAAS
ncbi:Methionine aminopeptidase 1 [Aspergillus tanneri]|uniref:Methionine aminopeptidase 1 n=1 Tax=Aspergillus tanneri TaxID=1220188 RepID=A0A5M9M593_9EURO|nr:Methionine aminopeptidase 1 [Aspergillus tanneri]KAA8641938.1 Methionine aminopeptidase 1 [Aspergillus tanneri]